ncbi:MAG: START domain-containing protein [Bacteroidota bacterium]
MLTKETTTLLLNIFYSVILTKIIFLNTLLIGQNTGSWELIKNYNNIKVYEQRIPRSQIKKIKVESVIVATLSNIVTLFKDAENHSNWVFLSERAEIIEEKDDFCWKYYSYSDSPWPVANRDYYTDVVLEQNKTDYSITITSVAIPDYKPKVDGCVRIPYINSIWTLNPIGNGSVHVSFELEIDPGGTIPPWVVNLVIAKGPYNTMMGLIDELKTNNCQNKKLEYINEL